LGRLEIQEVRKLSRIKTDPIATQAEIGRELRLESDGKTKHVMEWSMLKGCRRDDVTQPRGYGLLSCYGSVRDHQFESHVEGLFVADKRDRLDKPV